MPVKDMMISTRGPRSSEDYDPTVTVRALWRGIHDEIQEENARRHNAQVLKLGGGSIVCMNWIMNSLIFIFYFIHSLTFALVGGGVILPPPPVVFRG